MNNPLTQGQLSNLLSYNPETGHFTHRLKRAGVQQGNIAGSLMSSGYIQIRVLGKKYLAHRLAFLYMTGEMPDTCVDHIDGNTSNNSWCNLRQATHSQNMKNRKPVSGYKGVSRHRDKYRAAITAGGVKHYLGNYHTPEAAAQAYDSAAIQLHGHFARLNGFQEIAV